MRKNCWEVKNCGREPGGINAEELGICPAAIEVKLDGEHGGKNAGRCCWIIAGTLCGGIVQGTFAMKYHNCRDCEFYNDVRVEESNHFKFAKVLLHAL